MSFFTILPVTSSNDALPSINQGDVEGLFPLNAPLEDTAYAHWLFGKDEADFTSFNAARVLTKQNPASVIGFNHNYMTMSTVAGEALISDRLQGAVDDEFTVCFTFRTPDVTATAILAGDISAGTPYSGVSPYISTTGSLLLNARNSPKIDMGVTLANDTWYFCAFTLKYSSFATGQRGISFDGSAFIKGDVAPNVYVTEGGGIALGNIQYTSGADIQMDYSELIIFDRLLTDTEVSGVHARSVSRSAFRGLIVT